MRESWEERKERVSMSTAERMRIEKKGAIGTVILDNPGRLNVLDFRSLETLEELLTEIERDETIRVIVITGKRHFCAGADIRELKEKDIEKADEFAGLGQRVCDRLEKAEKPVIAAIDGYALGAGCEIALACDLRIASERAEFGQPEINLGLVPGFGGTQRLARLIGIGAAKDMVLTGRIVGAEEAGSLGLVNTVVKDEELLQKTEEKASLIAGKSPFALKLAKKLINEQQEILKGLERESVFFAECFSTEDHKEGILAFLEKREPKFTGR
jgi:enoyl-CoA hydratase